jgi:hypothetical protein
MDARAAYLLQILEKIGSPLMAAIVHASTHFAPAQVKNNPDSLAAHDAQKMAALLGKTVQLGIDIGNVSDLAREGLHDDSIRVALTALASPLIARQFLQNGQIPTDADLRRMIPALQAVMAFSENFEPSARNAQRLEAIGVHENQALVQYIHAFVPVLNALGNFSFGQSEQKLIMEVSSRLTAKAEALGRSIITTAMPEERKAGEIALLAMVANLYAACHEAETVRLMTLRDDEFSALPQAPGGGLSLEAVWSAFDIRVAMLEALAGHLLPGQVSAGAQAPAPVEAPPAVQNNKPDDLKDNLKQAERKPLTAPAQAAPVSIDKETAHNGSNPMAMFGAIKPGAKSGAGPKGGSMSFFSIPLKSGDERT